MLPIRSHLFSPNLLQASKQEAPRLDHNFCQSQTTHWSSMGGCLQGPCPRVFREEWLLPALGTVVTMTRCGWVALERGQGPAWVNAGKEGDASSAEMMEMDALSRTLYPDGTWRKTLRGQIDGTTLGKEGWTDSSCRNSCFTHSSSQQPKEKMPRSICQPGEVTVTGRGAGLPKTKSPLPRTRQQGQPCVPKGQHREVASPAPIPHVQQPPGEDRYWQPDLALLPGQLVPRPWCITRVEQF